MLSSRKLAVMGAIALASLSVPQVAFADPLYDVAKTSLEANIQTLGSGPYLTAGRHQFKSLWTRDFGFSVRGLLVLHRFDVIRNQLNALIANRRPSDSLVPRTLDSISAQSRVLKVVESHLFPWINPDLPLEDPLKPEYVSENNTEAIDSNLLVILSALSYVKASGDMSWWNENQNALNGIFHYYDKHFRAGLIQQPGYSDWQDSASREGETFYTNLLYFVVARDLHAFGKGRRFGISSRLLSRMRSRIDERFFDQDTSLYRSVGDHPQISLDGNLLALDWNYVTGADATSLFQALRRHPLWTGEAGIPGFVTYPDYPDEWISSGVKTVGLRHYHDELYWSWLSGLALKISRRFGETADAGKIYDRLAAVAARDGAIGEVYEPSADLPLWSSSLLESERPFSWGSAFVLDALATYPITLR